MKVGVVSRPRNFEPSPTGSSLGQIESVRVPKAKPHKALAYKCEVLVPKLSGLRHVSGQASHAAPIAVITTSVIEIGTMTPATC